MRILLADDHAMVRDGLVPFLERLEPGTVVMEAATFAEAEATVQKEQVNLVILDLVMPGMDGLAGLSSLRAHYPDLPIVILSGSTNPDDAFRAMEKGASGFVPKTMRGETILGVLRLILSGEKYVPPFLFEYRDRAAATPAPTAGSSLLAQLTPREMDILDMVVDGAPNKVIARALNLQEVTVKAHLRNMFRKMNVANRTEAAKVALMAGVNGRKVAEQAT